MISLYNREIMISLTLQFVKYSGLWASPIGVVGVRVHAALAVENEEKCERGWILNNSTLLLLIVV